MKDIAIQEECRNVWKSQSFNCVFKSQALEIFQVSQQTFPQRGKYPLHGTGFFRPVWLRTLIRFQQPAASPPGLFQALGTTLMVCLILNTQAQTRHQLPLLALSGSFWSDQGTQVSASSKPVLNELA